MRGQIALDWEGARVFVEIARLGSFRAAADRLHQSVNALRRRLDRLERSLGLTLLTRHVDGVRLTSEGERVLVAAQRMEAAAFELARGRNLDEAAQFGQVKLAITEGLGTFWVVPHLVEYQKLHPNLTVHVHCGMPPVDVLRLEADVAVQLVRPTAKDLKIVKLGRLHASPFASKSYIAEHGMPKSLADLSSHRFVRQIAEQVVPVEDYPEELQSVLAKSSAVMCMNLSSTHYSAIVNGAGIGTLPNYAYVYDNRLVPLDINIRSAHDIWLVYHQDSGRIARVHQLIDWLIASFSSQKFPWFGDDFIHPRDLPRQTDEMESCMTYVPMQGTRAKAGVPKARTKPPRGP